MPRYDYLCEKCGEFEREHSMDEKIEKCPQCGGVVKKLIVKPAGVIYRGPGFYTTENRAKARRGK